jgi:hypothetical protein
VIDIMSRSVSRPCDIGGAPGMMGQVASSTSHRRCIDSAGKPGCSGMSLLIRRTAVCGFISAPSGTSSSSSMGIDSRVHFQRKVRFPYTWPVIMNAQSEERRKARCNVYLASTSYGSTSSRM